MLLWIKNVETVQMMLKRPAQKSKTAK